ncbi:MAG: hypothetical protein OXF74_13590 [Rhodobacteraceae bacterium]|nr:hypothetical protein [Paracoccaceae bacterium]
MSVREGWAYTEEQLLRISGSMGQLLNQLRPHVSSRLIDGRAWENLLERAGEVPATFAAFPFGFEIPLQDPALRADFGVTLVGDSRTAAFVQKGTWPEKSRNTVSRLARFLDETDREDSLLRHVVGQKLLLEYDIDPGTRKTCPDPGVFLYPIDDVLAGGGQRIRELGAVHDAVLSAGGWQPDMVERRHFEHVYGELEAACCIKAVGTFPARQRVVRVAATGFRKAGQVTAFLRQVGWPGQAEAVGDTVSFFARRNAFAYLGIHLDITADSVGPKLGLSFFAQEKEWLKDIRHWSVLIDGIGERGYALPEKLAELARWSTGSATLLAPSGPIMLVRGIHHIKFAITGDRVEQVKGYVFFLMMSARNRNRGEFQQTPAD